MMAPVWPALRPLLFVLPPETAHAVTIGSLRLWGRHATLATPAANDPILGIALWDLNFPNPVGLAAGFDKDAAAIAGLRALGFGFVEVGTVTPAPQPGNPKPRLFRLTENDALINRLGFNSRGSAHVRAELMRAGRAEGGATGGAGGGLDGGLGSGLLGANIGKNRDSTDAAGDYAAGAGALAGLVDYLVVNVSSPNTEGLRALQERDALDELLVPVIEACRPADGAAHPTPLLVKLSPDLDEAQMEDVAEICMHRRVDGLIVANTTLSRPGSLRGRHRDETGGFSGPQLAPRATDCLSRLYRLTGGAVPLVSCGGVCSGKDAYARIRAGASLVQLYTALVYQGPGLVERIKRDLAAYLHRDGFGSLGEAVGVDCPVDTA